MAFWNAMGCSHHVAMASGAPSSGLVWQKAIHPPT